MLIKGHICYLKKRIYALKSTYTVCTYIGINAHIRSQFEHILTTYGTKSNIYETTYTDQNQHMLVTKMHVYVRNGCTYTRQFWNVYVYHVTYTFQDLARIRASDVDICCKLQHVYVQNNIYTCNMYTCKISRMQLN